MDATADGSALRVQNLGELDLGNSVIVARGAGPSTNEQSYYQCSFATVEGASAMSSARTEAKKSSSPTRSAFLLAEHELDISPP